MASDLRSRTIPNALPLGFIAVAAANSLALGTVPGWREALLVLAVGLVLFRFGAMGGGDVKAMASAALLFPGELPLFAMLVAVFGGLLSAAYILKRLVAKRPDAGLPYGVAIGLGVIACMAA